MSSELQRKVVMNGAANEDGRLCPSFPIRIAWKVANIKTVCAVERVELSSKERPQCRDSGASWLRSDFTVRA